MIKIKNLEAWVKWKTILKDISLNIKIWKNYWILWKNGSWKSTLSSVLMWNPKYEVTNWKIEINWENLLNMSPDERSKQWLFLSFQSVPEISGIKLWEFLRTIYNIHLKAKEPEIKDISPFIFKRFIKKFLLELKIDEKFLDRDLNVWFSWWEKRKIEILQMKLIWPKYIILDEIDSGLDLDAFKKVASFLESVNGEDNSLVIITHHFKIFDYIKIDKVYIIKDWEIEKKWWKELIIEIKENWYE